MLLSRRTHTLVGSLCRLHSSSCLHIERDRAHQARTSHDRPAASAGIASCNVVRMYDTVEWDIKFACCDNLQ